MKKPSGKWIAKFGKKNSPSFLLFIFKLLPDSSFIDPQTIVSQDHFQLVSFQSSKRD